MFEFKNKQDFIDTPRAVAIKHRGKYDYNLVEHATIHQWEPHAWVLEAMEKAYTQGLEDCCKIHKGERE